MILEDFAQYGIAIFSVGALVYVITFVVKKFLDFLKTQEESFNCIITNHLHDDMIAKNKLEASNISLTKAIEQLVRLLERKR